MSPVTEKNLELCEMIRECQAQDISGLIELWANSAALKNFADPLRWDWKARSSQIWAEHLLESLKDDRNLVLLSDFQDNGLSGYLIARLEILPSYYAARYRLAIQDVYLRPKERSAKLFQEVLSRSLAIVRERFVIPQEEPIGLSIECPASDHLMVEFLYKCGFKMSAAVMTIDPQRLSDSIS